MRRRWCIYSAATLFLFLSLEFVSFLGLKLIQARGAFFVALDPLRYIQQMRETLQSDKSYIVYNPLLGWSLRPNTRDKTGLYQSNSQGLRSSKEYTFEPDPDRMRIATFGDSFTHGDEVRNDETWQEKLTGLEKERLEVLNFGIPGQSPDQAYLRYRSEGIKFSPDLVVLGFMPENINRLINVFKPFYSFFFPFSKPRFVRQGDNIQLIDNPLPSFEDYKRAAYNPDWAIPILSKYDYWYHHSAHVGPLDFLFTTKLFKTAYYLYHRVLSKQSPYTLSFKFRESSEAFFVLEHLTRKMHKEVLSHEKKFMVLIFPTEKDIRIYKKDRSKRYQVYLNKLDEYGIVYFDFLDYLEGHTVEQIFGRKHYNAFGNQLLAKKLRTFLKIKGWLR